MFQKTPLIMRELIRSIAQEIEYHTRPNSAEFAILPGVKHIAEPFSSKNFRPLRRWLFPKSLLFIDGGSSEIIRTSTLSVFFIRVAHVSYNENEKIEQGKKEYFVVCRVEDNQFMSRVFPLKEGTREQFTFDLDDETLKDGVNIGSISKVGHVIRRFLELKYATHLATQEGSIIVLDGSLQSTYTHELPLLKKLLETGEKNDVLITALSKTNTLMTDSGVSVSKALHDIYKSQSIPYKTWYYYPLLTITDDHYPAELFMAKLHPRSKFLFKIELSKKNKVHIEKVLGAFTLNSYDPVFPGYPYGLIKVDDLARVTNEQSSFVRMRFLKHLDLENLETDLSAHAVLDTIKF
jgi:hypothetical protein